MSHFVLLFFWGIIPFSCTLAANPISRDSVRFEYWQLNDPWEQAKCTHENDGGFGGYDWKVECPFQGKNHSFTVHLALSAYPRSPYGKGSYELLYWVTDRSDSRSLRYSSTTLWIHNSLRENHMNVLEASQGIENDQAALRLTVKVP